MCCPTVSSLNNVLNKSATLPVISSSVGVYKPSNASTYTYKSLHAQNLFNKAYKSMGSDSRVIAWAPSVAMTMNYNIDSQKAGSTNFLSPIFHTQSPKKKAAGQSQHPDSDCEVRTGTGGGIWVT